MLLSWVVKRSDAQRQAVRELRRSGVPEASRNERVACVEPTHRVRSQPQSGCSARPVGLERVTVTRGPIGQFTVGCLAGARGALEDSRRQGTTDVAPEGPVQIARARKPFEGERAWRLGATRTGGEWVRVRHRRHGLMKLSASITGAVKARSNACGEHCAIDDAVIAGLPWRPRRAH